MPSIVTRWPIWYVLLALYCAYLGIEAFRYFQQSQPGLERAAASARTPLEKGRVAGYRARLISPAVGWSLAAVGLLTGWFWVQWAVAVSLLVSARTVFRDFATGFAEGRKASELAAAVEYVQGRTPPTQAAYVAAAGYAGLTRLLPAAAVLYAIWTR